MNDLATRSPTVAAGRRLGRRTRRAMLVAHLTAAGAWIGIDVVLAILVVTSVVTDDPQTQAVAFQALGMFAMWPLLIAALLTLATGIVLGIGTKFGLVRFWWVAIKLVLTIVLTTLIAVALRPGVNEVASAGRDALAGRDVALAAGDLVYPPAVSLVALLVAVILSVVKPWGRTGRSRTQR